MGLQEIENEDLDLVFGPDILGDTPEARAKLSREIFVRSQDHLGVYRKGATGRKLTAWEALNAFGFDLLLKAKEKGGVALVADGCEPARTLKARREALNLTPEDLARSGKITAENVLRAENPKYRSKIRDLVKIAQLLGLDDTVISFQPGARGDEELAVRLRQLGSLRSHFDAREVLNFDEAAWVIMTQSRLSSWIYQKQYQRILKKFIADDNYGIPTHPAWKVGYDLAEKTRNILGLNIDHPIEKLIELCEYQLQIPVIQAELPNDIAGATVSTSGYRGIVVNTRGASKNVWIRRITIAHELAHLLWDPENRLNKLRVDDYSEFNKNYTLESGDWVEQRANAFAVEFLAPSSVVRNIFQDSTNKNQAIRDIMVRFGISFTTAKYHIYNSLWRQYDIDDLIVDDLEPDSDWNGREGYTDTFFPIFSVPLSKRRKFSGLVVKAEKVGYISQDTATLFLDCTLDEYNKNKDAIEELFPI
ncbi:MAG: ImmA/IrrE family metallo-endopeptidase [Desulfobaccales bacterium]